MNICWKYMLPVTILGNVKAMRVWRIWDSTISSFLTTFLTEYRTQLVGEKRGPFVLFHPQVPFVLNSPYQKANIFLDKKILQKIDYHKIINS